MTAHIFYVSHEHKTIITLFSFKDQIYAVKLKCAITTSAIGRAIFREKQKCKVSQGICGINVGESFTSFPGERIENEIIYLFSEV